MTVSQVLVYSELATKDRAYIDDVMKVLRQAEESPHGYLVAFSNNLTRARALAAANEVGLLSYSPSLGFKLGPAYKRLVEREMAHEVDSDLVTRLRKAGEPAGSDLDSYPNVQKIAFREAADEIERLRALLPAGSVTKTQYAVSIAGSDEVLDETFNTHESARRWALIVDDGDPNIMKRTVFETPWKISE